MLRTTEPQVGEPIRSLQTFLRRISQENEKIPLVIPDGIYGVQTKNAVSDFQNYYGLPPTGETDFNTWKKITEIYDEIPQSVNLPDIRCLFPRSNYKIIENQTADCLYLIQALLAILANRFSNINAVEISGTHTPDSVEAVKKIQELSGLTPNGVIDIKTYNAIVSLYNNSD